MAKLPEIIRDEWEKKIRAPVVTTVDSKGQANSVYASCVSIFNEEKILIANNYFDKTLANLKAGCTGNLLFLTEEGTSYQLKGSLTHETEGEMFDDMKSWNPEKLPGVGVAILNVESIFSGSKEIKFD